jgi:hypothetical protein
MGGLFLTVDREKRQPQNDGYIAVITDAHPQRGDGPVTVLTVDVLPSMKAAKAWFRRMQVERPWEPRQ